MIRPERAITSDSPYQIVLLASRGFSLGVLAATMVARWFACVLSGPEAAWARRALLFLVVVVVALAHSPTG